MLLPLVITIFLQLYGVRGLSPQFLPCQLKKASDSSPLFGCPAGTIYVSSNPSDSNANFNSVQEAILSLHACEGEYHENVNVTRSAPLTLLGQVSAEFADSVDQPFANGSRKNLVQIFDTRYTTMGKDFAASAVLTVAPNGAAALIGDSEDPAGARLQPDFGNVDFKAYNIDFRNLAANYSISQALATDISYANASFYGCSFASHQDTWYTGRNGSTYVVDSVVFGKSDYLFGFGTAWFQNVILANRACGGGMVAWKGTNQNDTPGNRYGAYIADSQIIRSPDANATTNITQGCRPWNDFATTVFVNTFMENVVQPVGWKPFSGRPFVNTTFYAEFNSTGPGGNVSDRISIEHFLTPDEVKEFTLDSVFLGRPSWVDFDYKF
ncbi:pectin lyase-like protein [Marasmius fiardii PR-910]|nr:pectin lyase-like protein [Marasmius fiardii PR-910]